MNTKTPMALGQKTKNYISDRSLYASCFVASALAITPTLSANAASKDFGTVFGEDYTEQGKLSADTATETAGELYQLLKIVLVIIGLFIFAGGIFQLIKANKSQGQISPATGWMMIFGGAVLSVAGAVFFALGSGVKSTLVA